MALFQRAARHWAERLLFSSICSVEDFDTGEMGLKESEVVMGPGTRETGKDMIDAEEQPLFLKVCDQRNQIVAAALEASM